MKKDYIYQDKDQFKLMQNATRIGSYVAGDQGIVPAEQVLPEQRFAHQPVLGRPEEISVILRSYFAWRGFIVAGKEEKDGTDIWYEKFWLVRKKPLTQEAKDIEALWLGGATPEGISPTARATMKEYFVNANNFTIFKGRAWYANRTKLYTGKISDDGISLRGHKEVENIGYVATGRHVLRVTIYLRQGDSVYPYGMIAEEQMLSDNYHLLLRRYKAPSLTGSWIDDGVYQENISWQEAIDSQLSGLVDWPNWVLKKNNVDTNFSIANLFGYPQGGWKPRHRIYKYNDTLWFRNVPVSTPILLKSADGLTWVTASQAEKDKHIPNGTKENPVAVKLERKLY